jgi:Flp pilus assembly secretin CpaC
MRTFILAAAAAVSVSAPAIAQEISIEVDQAQSVRLATPITGVVVGNAGVADVIVHDANLLFVLGKSVGQTQVLAVDARGRTVYNGMIHVRAGEQAGLVTVQRGTTVSTVQCTTRCIGVAHPEATTEGLQGAIGAVTARNGFTRGGGGGN